MKLVLLRPPSNLHDPLDLAPPLGLLTLAAIARASGHEVRVLDFNLEVLRGVADPGEGFYRYATKSIVCGGVPDVIGFSSMCLESHVSLELARRIKSDFPHVRTVFGGTHFGTISNFLLEYFDFVDAVIEGEAECSLLPLLHFFESGCDRPENLPSNCASRWSEGIVRGSVPMQVPDLDILDMPAYDLVSLQEYFEVNPRRLLCYEAGRGCVFKCSFCYSPAHYTGGARRRSPERVIVDFRKLIELGAEHVFVVDDNFLNYPDWARDVCSRLKAENPLLSWSCYLTHPQLNSSIITMLAEAGCESVFIGIDAVSIAAQKRLNKKFFREWSKVLAKLRRCVEAGIVPTCAFILDPADKDIGPTIEAALDCRAIGCDVHLNALTIYNSTPLDGKDLMREYSEIKVRLLLDAAPVVQINPLALEHPELFPYHVTTGMAKPEWEEFVAKVYGLFTVLYVFDDTARQILQEHGGAIDSLLSFWHQGWPAMLSGVHGPASRRLCAALDIAAAWYEQEQSTITRRLLDREYARMFLSLRKEDLEEIYIQVGSMSPQRALLAPCVPVGWREFYHISLQEQDDTEHGFDWSGWLRVEKEELCEFAVVCGDEIQIVQNERELGEVLGGLKAGQITDLREAAVDRLLEEGWLSLM